MSDSDTSSDAQIAYHDSTGKDLLENKSKTTDTDYYFGMLANPAKISNDKTVSESSVLSDILNSNSSKSSKSSKSSNAKYENISIRSPKPNNYNQSNKNYTEPNYNQSNNNYNQSNNNYNQPNKNYTEPNNNYNQPNSESNIQEVKQLTPQEIRMKKIELLRKLSEIKTKGFQLTKDYDFNSSIEEMEYEYEILKSFADKRNGIKMYKNILLQSTSVIEFLNDKYDPFDFHLSGWSEHMSVESDNWDDVWEEIYEKYKGTGKKMAPEVKLLYLIVASASAFHFSKSFSSKLPGLDSVLTSNPGLLSKIINPQTEKSSQFMSAQEISIEKQREELKKRDIENKMLQQKLKQQQQQQQQEPLPYTQIPQQIPANDLRPSHITIKTPDQVKDILNRIHNIQPSSIRSTNLDTQEDSTSNNDRLVSDNTISDSKPKGKKKIGIKIF
jgi:hypothetical protein